MPVTWLPFSRLANLAKFPHGVEVELKAEEGEEEESSKLRTVGWGRILAGKEGGSCNNRENKKMKKNNRKRMAK